MNLIPEPSKPGLWINQDWRPEMPGAFAVIIGISKYEYLTGKEDTFGLGQLGVSALTSYDFFCWLRDLFRCSGITLAKCWLLLSPSPAELAFRSELDDHLLPPTYQNCEDAIGAWYEAMKELDENNATKSRSFFFFSGHGLEVTLDKQILLPQDYLRPPGRNVNRALSTQNLAQGVKALKVPYHFFFLDACRNDHNDLGGVAALDGMQVLNVLKSSLNNPDCLVPLFYASASGTQAWQPSDPSYGASVYGQALLEGLRAQAGIQPSCSPIPCRVNLPLLKTFVDSRVTQIIQNYQVTESQRVRLAGEFTDVPVTEVDFNQAASAPEPPTPAEIRESVFGVQTPVAQWRPDDWAEAHNIFGSENMTDIWTKTARVYSLPQANPTQPLSLPSESFVIHNVERDSGTRFYRIELSITNQREGLYWLQFTDLTNKTFGCILPGDTNVSPRYLFELDLDYSDIPGEPRSVSRMDVGLAFSNAGNLGQAAALWEKYELKNVIEAADATDIEIFEKMLQRKNDSPLTAAVAGLILLRARRWTHLHNWLRNVANWFDYLPDGPILWVEQLLRQSNEDLLRTNADDSFMRNVDGYWQGEPRKIVEYLIELEKRGLPSTSEGLGYAARQVETFLNYGDLTSEQRSRLDPVQKRLQHALRFFRSGGLFCVFAGPSDQINPSLVQGKPQVS